MTGLRQVVLCVSPELYARMESRARADRFDLEEWVLRAVIGELLHPEPDLAARRRIRDVLVSLTARPATERNFVHAPHP